MRQLSHNHLGPVKAVSSMAACLVLCVAGCAQMAPRAPQSDVPVVYELGSWSEQHRLTVEELAANVVLGEREQDSGRVLLSLRVQGTLLAEPGWKPQVSAVHVTESFYPDTCHHLVGNDSTSTWVKLRLTPIVELHPSPGHAGSPEPFDVTIEKWVSVQETERTEIDIVAQSRTTHIELVSRSSVAQSLDSAGSRNSSTATGPYATDAIGTRAPFALLDRASDDRWVVLCQPREDSNGDGLLSWDDEVHPYLIVGAGRGFPIDSFLGHSKDGRLVGYSVESKKQVLNVATGETRDFDTADDDLTSRMSGWRTCDGHSPVLKRDTPVLVRHDDGSTLMAPGWHFESIEAQQEKLEDFLDWKTEEPSRNGPLYRVSNADYTAPPPGTLLDKDTSPTAAKSNSESHQCVSRLGTVVSTALPARFDERIQPSIFGPLSITHHPEHGSPPRRDRALRICSRSSNTWVADFDHLAKHDSVSTLTAYVKACDEFCTAGQPDCWTTCDLSSALLDRALEQKRGVAGTARVLAGCSNIESTRAKLTAARVSPEVYLAWWSELSKKDRTWDATTKRVFRKFVDSAAKTPTLESDVLSLVEHLVRHHDDSVVPDLLWAERRLPGAGLHKAFEHSPYRALRQRHVAVSSNEGTSGPPVGIGLGAKTAAPVLSLGPAPDPCLQLDNHHRLCACLEQKVAADWAAARNWEKQLDEPQRKQLETAGLVQILRAFETQEAALDWLRDLGLEVHEQPKGATLNGLLASQHVLEVETFLHDNITNADDLLFHVMGRRSDLFDGVRLDALARTDSPGASAALRVYFDGKKIEANLWMIAEESLRAGWGNRRAEAILLRAALGVLNQVAFTRGHNARVGLLKHRTTRLELLVAPEAAHCALRERGFLGDDDDL